MKRILTILLALCLLFGSCGTQSLTKQAGLDTKIKQTREIMADEVQNLSTFSMKLWLEASRDKSNTVLSPLSAIAALGMAANGAVGETVNSFAAMGINEENMREVSEEIAGILRSLMQSDLGKTKISAANSVWMDNAFHPQESYVSMMASTFGAEVFSEKLVSAAGKVNGWVKDKTDGLIEKLMDDISEQARLLLINTILMKAEWERPFEKAGTYRSTFIDSKGLPHEREFMNNGSAMEAIIENEDMIGAVLPYAGGRLHFVALMPKNDAIAPEAFLELLAGYDLSELTASAEDRFTDLSLPKFEVCMTSNLRDPLTALGFGPAFEETANFENMGTSNGESLHIGGVLQNVVLKVDEKGTEAAAATVVQMDGRSSMPDETDPPFKLVFDRPFLYAVMDSQTGAILFCGDFDNPPIR